MAWRLSRRKGNANIVVSEHCLDCVRYGGHRSDCLTELPKFGTLAGSPGDRLRVSRMIHADVGMERIVRPNEAWRGAYQDRKEMLWAVRASLLLITVLILSLVDTSTAWIVSGMEVMEATASPNSRNSRRSLISRTVRVDVTMERCVRPNKA